MKKYLTLIVIFTLHFFSTIAQDNCPTKQYFRTNTIGNGDEMFPYYLNFNVKGDTISITSSMLKDKQEKGDLLFTVISKKCTWKNNFTEGKSEYELAIDDEGNKKTATLKLLLENKIGKIILRYHGNDELRVIGFTLH